MTTQEVRDALLENLTDRQQSAVTSGAQSLLIVAGAGSGKTEVMARRIAWWVAMDGVPKDNIIAFTFTEKAADEMKFRIRKWIGAITPEGEDATLGGMYVGTIHAFCLRMLQELRPEAYGVFDILDDTGRLAMVQRWFNHVLGLPRLKQALDVGQFDTIRDFLLGYDLLNEYGIFQARGPSAPRPAIGVGEREWISEWILETDVGDDETSQAFALSAARYYGALQARRLFDFSTAQSELVRLLNDWPDGLAALHAQFTHVVVDEFQDVNPVQDSLVRMVTEREGGVLTAVGDHRQAIYGWRGGDVEIMSSWHGELLAARTGEVIGLPHNFRSTDRIIDLANKWVETITPLGALATPNMTKGRETRTDHDASHVAFRRFDSRSDEADWIAQTVEQLVDEGAATGVRHDVNAARERGLGLPDIAVLLRSARDARTYMDALDRRGIPAVVRAGPDLFRRPEVLFLVSALATAAGIDQFYWGRPPTMASIAQEELSCSPEPEAVLRAAADRLASAGLPVTAADVDRLVDAARLVRKRIGGDRVRPADLSRIATEELRGWLLRRAALRRVYPQTLFQWLAAEAGVAKWDALEQPRAITAMFHLGQLASLITGIETPGWVTPGDLKWQVIALTNWGARNARSDEAPLLVAPDAVTISTIHAAKGLEYPVVFLADVAARRFPSQKARVAPSIPFSGPALDVIDPSTLADNENYDAERRLMYVALTRAERYLFVTTGSSQRSRFERELKPLVLEVGGQVDPSSSPEIPDHLPTESDPTFRLVTSFSDLRYYLECPHDYYLRKVLGFAPTIDQAFGYGRGVHNLMRAIHLEPGYFASLAQDPAALEQEVQQMIDEGLFYLRYTTGEPLENMKRRAREVVSEYVVHYRDELGSLEFEPERVFETLIEESGLLVSGAIDVIRHEVPPHVTLIDFKSGDPSKDNENASGLDAEQMRLQLSLYGLGAKSELEYEPDLGLVRYLGVRSDTPDDERELAVQLDDQALLSARQTAVEVANDIQRRHWSEGPRRGPKKPGNTTRCQECDFILLCGRPEASRTRE